MSEMIGSAEKPPDGVPSNGIIVLNDLEQGRSLVIGLFETEADLKTGDEALRAMDSPPEAAGDVSSVEFYEVAVDRRM
ncbi:MAG TPA: hypothetical protein VFY44_04065 [Thermoleophilaceae bacterium]|nr:hypothetical protein [Thermoleophilaceae bacterium]